MDGESHSRENTLVLGEFGLGVGDFSVLGLLEGSDLVGDELESYLFDSSEVVLSICLCSCSGQRPISLHVLAAVKNDLRVCSFCSSESPITVAFLFLISHLRFPIITCFFLRQNIVNYRGLKTS